MVPDSLYFFIQEFNCLSTKALYYNISITTKFFIHFFIQNLRKYFRPKEEEVAHFLAMKQKLY